MVEKRVYYETGNIDILFTKKIPSNHIINILRNRIETLLAMGYCPFGVSIGKDIIDIFAEDLPGIEEIRVLEEDEESLAVTICFRSKEGETVE